MFELIMFVLIDLIFFKNLVLFKIDFKWCFCLFVFLFLVKKLLNCKEVGVVLMGFYDMIVLLLGIY